MLTNITIKNYSTIKSATLKPRRVNVFIGENGAGKTTLLDAVRQCFGPGLSGAQFGKFNDGRAIHWGTDHSPREIVNGTWLRNGSGTERQESIQRVLDGYSGRTVSLDLPETNLAPLLRKNIAESIAEERNDDSKGVNASQYFIATHDLMILETLYTKTHEDEFALFYVQKRGGVTTVHQIIGDDLDDTMEQGYPFFQAEHIVNRSQKPSQEPHSEERG
ncbi:MAG: AAA family ATPase [bacterium]|nr:AAA family ATPase [bacterium]